MDLLIILSISLGSLLGLYSIYNVYKAMKLFRFQKIWRVMGLGFISNTILFIIILLLHLFGLLNKIGWAMFIHPAIFGSLTIWAIFILRRKLHAS
ncbi:hypothetical protein AKJ40_02555 [candidate division MSBL1 archaeon SCGC-AAA259M10]|uniref:Uncharacterized protein n=2 Tax=candidate division MSBL1 TaxID=215777 RepID=A0A133UZU8_9EURY|nr:hypothetical protein AKJ66_03355 [candidate division MSBL1 archaeon SCGC-AAA259E22]KXA99725.1 hypothetical protein AKJ40_02555 [candidate division MSBL1 archaeon SCGC-AAA259M10]